MLYKSARVFCAELEIFSEKFKILVLSSLDRTSRREPGLRVSGHRTRLFAVSS
jgi:hypothetical protein